MIERNSQIIDQIINELSVRFKGVREYLGHEYNFDVLAQHLKALESVESTTPLAPLSLSTHLSIAIIETGLFEIRVYSRTSKEAWNPLDESLASFKARNIEHKVQGYVDGKSTPGLVEVKEWVDDFFLG